MVKVEVRCSDSADAVGMSPVFSIAQDSHVISFRHKFLKPHMALLCVTHPQLITGWLADSTHASKMEVLE